LAVGADADIVLLDSAGQVCMTVVGGEIAYQRHAADRPERER
jgi:N-acetylglucosamine-6-phosphate deacetylase